VAIRAILCTTVVVVVHVNGMRNRIKAFRRPGMYATKKPGQITVYTMIITDETVTVMSSKAF